MAVAHAAAPAWRLEFVHQAHRLIDGAGVFRHAGRSSVTCTKRPAVPILTSRRRAPRRSITRHPDRCPRSASWVAAPALLRENVRETITPLGSVPLIAAFGWTPAFPPSPCSSNLSSWQQTGEFPAHSCISNFIPGLTECAPIPERATRAPLYPDRRQRSSAITTKLTLQKMQRSLLRRLLISSCTGNRGCGHRDSGCFSRSIVRADAMMSPVDFAPCWHRNGDFIGSARKPAGQRGDTPLVTLLRDGIARSGSARACCRTTRPRAAESA